jgi:hypothetical protein
MLAALNRDFLNDVWKESFETKQPLGNAKQQHYGYVKIFI